MSDFLNKSSTLVLNALYQIIGQTSPRQAVVAMNSSSDGERPAAKAINIEYGKKEDGSWDFDNVIGFKACSFEEWLEVPIRNGIDQVIHGAKIQIRSPSIIVTSYSKMPLRKFRPTKTVLFEKQKGICGYSGVRLPYSKLNIEHKIARSHGGKSNFENLMLVNKDINSKRGNKKLEDVGLVPLFFHQEPRPIPASYAVKNAAHVDWFYFLPK
jgi:5-methylcytosine-specific restriction endonuclease McrA